MVDFLVAVVLLGVGDVPISEDEEDDDNKGGLILLVLVE